MVPKVRFELTRPYGHYALNVARLPFRHFGTRTIMVSQNAAFNQISRDPTGGRYWTRTSDLVGVNDAL